MIGGGGAGAGLSGLDLESSAAGRVAAGQQCEIAGSAATALQIQRRDIGPDIGRGGSGEGLTSVGF